MGFTPVSAFLLQSGVRIFSLSGRLANACVVSRGILLDEGQVLSLCRDLGIVISYPDFVFLESRLLQCFWISPTPLRIEEFFSVVEEFLPSKV